MSTDDMSSPPQDRIYGFVSPLAKLDGYYGVVASKARSAEQYSLETAIHSASRAAKRFLQLELSKLSHADAWRVLAHAMQYREQINSLLDIPWDKANLKLDHFRERLLAVTDASRSFADALNTAVDSHQSNDPAAREMAKNDAEVKRWLAGRAKEMEVEIVGLKAQLEADRAEEASRRKAEEIERHELKTLAQSLQAPAARKTSTENAEHFQKQSQGHAKEAEKWEARTRWVTVGTFLFALVCMIAPMVYVPTWLNDLVATPSQMGHIHLAVGKVLTFSTLVYAIFFCARNYMAERHNAVLNDHRANALKTYEVLVAAVGDSHKDTILTKASDCIFNQQATGFTKHDVADAPAVALLTNVATTATRGPQTPGG